MIISLPFYMHGDCGTVLDVVEYFILLVASQVTTCKFQDLNVISIFEKHLNCSLGWCTVLYTQGNI